LFSVELAINSRSSVASLGGTLALLGLGLAVALPLLWLLLLSR
jgi:hypothetical protein